MKVYAITITKNSFRAKTAFWKMAVMNGVTGFYSNRRLLNSVGHNEVEAFSHNDVMLFCCFGCKTETLLNADRVYEIDQRRNQQQNDIKDFERKSKTLAERFVFDLMQWKRCYTVPKLVCHLVDADKIAAAKNEFRYCERNNMDIGANLGCTLLVFHEMNVLKTDFAMECFRMLILSGECPRGLVDVVDYDYEVIRMNKLLSA